MNFSTGLTVFMLSIIATGAETIVSLYLSFELAANPAMEIPNGRGLLQFAVGAIFIFRILAGNTLLAGVVALFSGIIETASRKPDRGMRVFLGLMTALFAVQILVLLMLIQDESRTETNNMYSAPRPAVSQR